jgi:hypothetical protein
MLGAMCYEQAKDRTSAVEMLEDYLQNFRDGTFAQFASKKLTGLRARGGR